MWTLFRDDIMTRIFAVQLGEKCEAFRAYQIGQKDNLDSVIDKLGEIFKYEPFKVNRLEHLESKEVPHVFELIPDTSPWGVYWPQNILGYLGFDLDD